MFTMGLYFLMLVLLFISLIKSHEKTLLALKKAWKSFENILPLFLSILFIIGIMLAILSPQVISKIMGHQSGILGLALAALIGSCTVIPGFVTFPLAATLLKNGAGMAQITMLISTSVMVGIITIPIESKYWGKKATYVRNSLALVFSFAIAFVMGVLI
ncbi:MULTISPECIES: permease [Clostridium]|uniref:Putative permease n=1 Tax=Clostridium ragsdalei P11 TaxID=1353534 RepID=A0A1A6AZH1_9CLOT|nr:MULTISPECIES: permease [Clostridium]OBR95486.1 putative permease [Clostridium ragsdalei P11]QXE17990.1 permease [Clostridium sp. 001]